MLLFINQGNNYHDHIITVDHLFSILGIIALLIVLSLIYFILVARRLTRTFSLFDLQMHLMADDLNHIADTTREIAGGDLSRIFSVRTEHLLIQPSDETGVLTRTLNLMHDRLRETGESIVRITTNLSRQNAELNILNKALEEKNVIIEREMCECRKIETALHENERKFRTISISAIDAIIMIDNSGAVSYWNPAAEKIFGYSEKEIMGANLHTILASPKHLEAHRKAFPHWQRTGEGGVVGKVLELSAICKNGREIPVELSLSSVQIGNVWHAIGIARDISERMEAQDALDASLERLRFIYESSDAIMFLTEKGFFDCNQRTLDLFGIDSKAEFIMFHPGDVSPPVQADGRDSRQAADEKIQKALEEGFNRFEWIHRRRNGENFPAEVLLSAFNYRGTTVLQATVHDITAHRKMAEDLKRAKEEAEQANRIKSKFIANISHEIRTPINSIIGFSELLGRRITDGQSIEYVKGILTSGRNLLSLIEDILDLSKIEAGRMALHLKPVNLQSFCEEMVQIFAVQTSEKGIALNVSLSPDLPGALMLDEVRFRQILLNLIGNAVKFTDEGSVFFRALTENSEADSVDLVIEVADTGIGISEDQKEMIFEAFLQQEGQSTRRFGGTGLGLTITRRLVRMMGGNITLESELGKGSTFRVCLPGIRVAAVEPPPPAEEFPDLENIRFNGAVVMLAEDMEPNRLVIADLLKPHDVNLLTAANGQEAIEKVRLTTPGIILMDLQMPVMDGYEAITILKNDDNYRSIPIVAITASSLDQDSRNIKALINGYLRKPLTKNQLIRELARFLPYSLPEAQMTAPSLSVESTTRESTQISPEVMNYLIEEISTRWKEVRSTMVVEDIKTFASDLREIGSLHGIRSLREYGETLHQQASFFKIDRMIQTLERFSTLLDADRK